MCSLFIEVCVPHLSILLPVLQVFALLQAPFYSSGGRPLLEMGELRDKRNEHIRYLFQLCYQLVRLSQHNYRKNQVGATVKRAC